MSRIEGIAQFREKLLRFEDEVATSINDAVIAETKAMQAEVVAAVPVDEGDGRDALADEGALRIVKSPDGPGIRVIFGLDVPRLAKKAFHLFWVEFGTKSYMRGESRKSGVTKNGRQRWRRMKRAVPARPAQPFWRMAEANLWRRMERRLNLARIVGVAKRAAGMADQS